METITSLGKDIIEKSSFITKLNLLSKATSDNDQPTSGFTLQEISKITYESKTNCNDLVLYLTDRLQKRSCFVKIKVLKILKHLLKNCDKEFMFILQNNSFEITKASKYSGPADPLHGYLLYNKVRQLAQEILSNLFSEKLEECDGTSHLANLPGIGNNSSGKMIGFGNTVMNERSTVDGFRDLVDKIVEYTSNTKKEITFYSSNENDSYLNSYSNINVDLLNKEKTFEKAKTKKNVRRKGFAGGGWEDDIENVDSTNTLIYTDILNSICSQDEDNNCSQNKSIESCSIKNKNNKNFDEDSQDLNTKIFYIIDSNQDLTYRICKKLLKSLAKNSFEDIIFSVNTKLTSEQSNHLFRTLLIIEHCLHSGLFDYKLVAETCSYNLSMLLSSKYEAVQIKSKKILMILAKLVLNKPHLFTCLTKNKIEYEVE